MKTYISPTLGARAFCSCTLLMCVLATLDLYRGVLTHSWMNFDYVLNFDFLRLPVVLLMCIFAVWILLGIRTRVIAFFAIVLVTTLILFDFTTAYAVSGPAAAWEFAHATAFLLGLLFLSVQGGGETALVRGGWQGLF